MSEPKSNGTRTGIRAGGGAQQAKPGTSGSMTMTIDQTGTGNTIPLVLEPRRGIQWVEGTIDNEHMNKRSSKRCCIFHKRRKFGESSSESDSDYEENERKNNDDPPAQEKGKPNKPKPHETYHA